MEISFSFLEKKKTLSIIHLQMSEDVEVLPGRESASLRQVSRV